MEKKAQRNFLWVALLALGTIGILARHNRAVPYQTVSGLIFGTVYNITYQYDSNLKAEIEAELKRFDGSLSPFNDTATITRINRKKSFPILSSPTYSAAAWKSPGRPKVLLTLR